jgi:alpha-L-arabinofuranosidase
VWYDISIELQGASVKCYLNDKLIQEAATQPTRSLFATAGRDEKRGETVISVANASSQPQTTKLQLTGARKVAGKALVTVLAADGPEAENSFAQPNHVMPQTQTLSLSGAEFEHQFPPWSLTILRVKTN